jgi:hypothetical protein
VSAPAGRPTLARSSLNVRKDPRLSVAASGNPKRITKALENCLLLDCILLLTLHVTRHGRAFSAIGVTKGNLTVNSSVMGAMSNVLLFWCKAGLE